jgi:hypothetical protein
MNSRTPWLIAVSFAALCGVMAIVLWGKFEGQSGSILVNSARQSPKTVERVQSVPTKTTRSQSPIPSPAKPILRERFREAKDYAQLVKELGPSAGDGNPEAQYVIAQALRWCGRTLKLYFIRSNGHVRTLDEVQARRAAQPAGISQNELAAIYTRCEGFLEDPDLLENAGSWDQWLDKAVSANYPAAMAEKARLLEADIVLASASQLPHDAPAAGAEDQAKNLALLAVQSGDPDAIFSMSDWVRAGDRSPEENAIIISAWQILACQKGYDCGPSSDFLKARCDWDVQCAEGQSYIDYFRRQLGTQYDDALALSKTIDQAIAANDVQAIRSHL